jgi:hypothetical protein
MHDLTFFTILLTLLAGFAAGFINTLAGSGSSISLALLMFLGLPANVANGTNRLMILLSSLVGILSFKKLGAVNDAHSFKITIPAILGAILGAMLAVTIEGELMTRIIGALMVVLLLMVIYKPEKWVKQPDPDHVAKFKGWQYIALFLVGFYGGFIQAGVGIFLLASLVLTAGFDVIKANVLKVFIVLIYTLFIIPIFIWKGQVDFTLGMILAVGSMFGAYVATKVAISWGPKFVRWLLIVVISWAAIEFLGIAGWVMVQVQSIK